MLVVLYANDYEQEVTGRRTKIPNILTGTCYTVCVMDIDRHDVPRAWWIACCGSRDNLRESLILIICRKWRLTISINRGFFPVSLTIHLIEYIQSVSDQFEQA